jgi:hypothetical protein
MAIEGPSDPEFRRAQPNEFIEHRETWKAFRKNHFRGTGSALVHPRRKAVSPKSRKISELHGYGWTSSFAAETALNVKPRVCNDIANGRSLDERAGGERL